MIGNKIGKLGEDIAKTFLMKQGYDVFTRNYLKKFGEIDLIARKSRVTHFIEVKAVSRESIENISYETGKIRPEDNLHDFKLRSLSKVVQAYLSEHKEVGEWRFDLCVVYMDVLGKKAKVKFIQNLILPE